MTAGSCLPDFLSSSILSFLLASLLICADCVRIRQLYVPPPMRNGTVTAAVLDCDYTYEEYEKVGLVVKWFLHHKYESAYQVYQWIPNQTPQDLSVLKGRLDLTYRATDDNYTMHRALRILNPTTELTGDYRCQVSTFESEDDRTERMIVYAEAKTFHIRYHKPSIDSVNISCLAVGVYPKPEVEIFIYKGSRENVTPVKGPSVVATKSRGAYDVTASKLFQEKSLAAETEFECIFSIPGTGYKTSDKLLFYPGLSRNAWQAESGASSSPTTLTSFLASPASSSSKVIVNSSLFVSVLLYVAETQLLCFLL